MSDDAIETRYCRYVEEVLNHHHLDRLATYLAPDVVVHALGVPPGVAGARQVLASYLSAFLDLHLTIDTLLALDGELLARLTATGTHTGPFLGLAPTGQRVRVSPSRPGGWGTAGVPSIGCCWIPATCCASSGDPSTEPFPRNGRQWLAEARSGDGSAGATARPLRALRLRVSSGASGA